MTTTDQRHEENVRDVELIQHMNETISHDDSYRAQTEASNIQIVTPHYKSADRPGSEIRTGASGADLNAKFSDVHGDYKAERSQEHFRMQIIDPKVDSNAHLPVHIPHEYARKKLIEDFPSLHSKRSFLDLEALEQRSVRKLKPISISKYLTDSVERHPKKDDFRDLDRLKQSLDALQKAATQPKEPPPAPPTPLAPPVVKTVVRNEPPVRHEVVEIRREMKPKVTKNVQRFEERKRTEEVERRIIRRERRHKSSRIRYGHNSGYGGPQQHEFHDWNERIRSNSAASRNGYGSGSGGDYYYHNSPRHGGADTASDRFYHRGADQARFGSSVTDSLRRGDLKYGPNGDVREHSHHNGNTSEKYNSTRRVHKSYSTRDIYGSGGSGHNYSAHQPVVEFPPTLPRHGASQQNGYFGAPAPPPHRQNAFHDYYGGRGYGSGRLTKSRSYADWGDGGRGSFGNSIRRYDDDMARLENEFRDSLLMKLPTNGGKMNEKDYRHEKIPGGYETYEREVEANSGRKYNPDGAHTDFKESSHAYNFKRETQR